MVGVFEMSKYNNLKVTYDGLKFDSKKELARYHELKLLERIGEISHLKTQVSFEIAPSVILGGRKRPARRYLADFSYVSVKDGALVVEDVKGVKTAVYTLKRHIVKAIYNIEIMEI
jgi:hypothetical protein